MRQVDMRLVEDLFDMSGGYVLEFSNPTFSEFFKELGINIDGPSYSLEGTSKAKRLRCFLKQCDSQLRIRVLEALWEYRQHLQRRRSTPETIPRAEVEYLALIDRLSGGRPAATQQTAPSSSSSSIDAIRASSLATSLLELERLNPHPRGFAFEKFLKDLFDLNGLAARASFRLVGEQIDGSFELASETYLLEAKWTGPAIGAAELRAFDGKVADKAAWSRGLFVSHSGFTTEGLSAFGRGKRVVCMDGLDLYDMLERKLRFSDVMARKVRHAAESGELFASVRNLYS